ncbi:hypothetical protein [Mycobacterium sp.]|uniref:hypothetical protein n=1 Tax=Mycobacterium sp. TaxID=1785 RepID=UPI003C72C6AE
MTGDDDPDLAHRMFMVLLQEEIAELSDKIEAAEHRARRLQHLHGHDHPVRHVAQLRRRFYEAHRLLDGLHRHFPETVDRSQPRAATRR